MAMNRANRRSDMDDTRIAALGDELFGALEGRFAVAPLTEREAAPSLDEAYRISLHILERRLARGERVVGKKIGVTSRAVQDMLGVFQPDFGFLTDAMAVPSGGAIATRERFIQPRAEGEIAFRLKARLQGPGIDAAQVAAATEEVFPCIEIVDSRIRDWKIRIEDTVADNASCGAFVLGGEGRPLGGLDLANITARFEKNGEHLATGRGENVEGSPLEAVAWLANTLGGYGMALEAGDIVLSGALVPLEPAAPGDSFAVEVEGLGRCEIRFE